MVASPEGSLSFRLGEVGGTRERLTSALFPKGSPSSCSDPPPSEQLTNVAPERPAQLAEGPDGHILVGALDPIQGGTADAEAPRHCDLGESGGLPKAVKCLGESACEVHTEDSCSLGCPHVNIRRDAGCVAPTVVDKLRFACRRVPCLG